MMNAPMAADIKKRFHILIKGKVQGIGFRPFVYHLASRLQLAGWVQNHSQGAVIEVEGRLPRIELFLSIFKDELPDLGEIYEMDLLEQNLSGAVDFEIRTSGLGGEKSAVLLPDLAVCSDCTKDIFDKNNRRYHYPFTNCTQCGPRFSILQSLPYDRANTTMRLFSMCPLCEQEYKDPNNRRFHAQPNACPDCGPQAALWTSDGVVVETKDKAISRSSQLIEEGKILAVKGLGGFQLMADAQNEKAIAHLRQKKNRPHKPLAVMMLDIEMVERFCHVNPEEKEILSSSAAPIVLLPKKTSFSLPDSLAAENADLGVLLPTTPLHRLLIHGLRKPLVCTSGNRAEEPICIDNEEALKYLGSIADFFLIHDRLIERPMDDSVVKVVKERPLIIRAARGLAPITILSKLKNPSLVGLGGHLKTTLTITTNQTFVVSQHIGDLDSPKTKDVYQKTKKNLEQLYDLKSPAEAGDEHPDYQSNKFEPARPRQKIQHHFAHLAAVLCEHQIDTPVLGVVWDGVGLGPDGTLWGGEFLLGGLDRVERVGTFRSFCLPGGEAAIQEPRRSAVGLLYEMMGGYVFKDHYLPSIRSFSSIELGVLQKICEKKLNSPVTSSVGRLFDAVASLIGLTQTTSFEGQAAMGLESESRSIKTNDFYPFIIRPGPLRIVDWEPMIWQIMHDADHGLSLPIMATLFHNSLVEIIVSLALEVGNPNVVLTGGCFQNRYLLGRAIEKLKEAGFNPIWPNRVPPNDGGLSLGQAAAAAERIRTLLCV